MYSTAWRPNRKLGHGTAEEQENAMEKPQKKTNSWKKNHADIQKEIKTNKTKWFNSI